MLNNLIICFPGGSGGHLIANICANILYSTPISILKNGSVHSFRCSKYLDNIKLDCSTESFLQELADIQRLPDFDLAIAHYRNIMSLREKNKKIIYISIDESDIGNISNRLQLKMSDLINQETYNTLKGSDWPEYGSKVDSNVPDDLNELRLRFFKNWYYIVPVNKTNILEIPFKNLTHQHTIDSIAKFLNISTFNKQYITDKLHEYQESQKHV
jgi:ribose 5-phosphate isomerase RpiB